MLPQCLLPSFSSTHLMVLEEMSKMWKVNDGRTMDNRPLHKLTWSKAPVELKTIIIQVNNYRLCMYYFSTTKATIRHHWRTLLPIALSWLYTSMAQRSLITGTDRHQWPLVMAADGKNLNAHSLSQTGSALQWPFAYCPGLLKMATIWLCVCLPSVLHFVFLTVSSRKQPI